MSEAFNPYRAPGAPLDLPNTSSAPRSYKLTGLEYRVGAFVIDGLLVYQTAWVANLAMNFIEPRSIEGEFAVGSIFVVNLLVVTAVQVYLLAKYAQTVGKRLLKIQIRRTDGSFPALGRLLLRRQLLPWLTFAIPLVGFVFLAVDTAFAFRKNRRALHDWLADTVVVELRSVEP